MKHLKAIAVIGIVIAIIAVAFVALSATGEILPEPEVQNMPDVQDGTPAYKYIQLHGELSKRVLAQEPVPIYQVQVYRRAAYVYDTLPAAPLWAARGHQGSDMHIIVTLTGPDGQRAVQTLSYGYADLPTFKSGPSTGVADVTIGGYFGVSGPGTYMLHMGGEEYVNGQWVPMDDTTWQDDPYDTVTVVVP